MSVHPMAPAPLRHHTVRREAAPGVWVVARPLRSSSWLFRWREERDCRKVYGHCWHPESYVDWWCCFCSAETDGMPPQRCIVCTRAGDPP